jgi:hypothetical protein
MLALIGGDDVTVAHQLEDLRTYAAQHERLRSGPPSTVLEIPAGIVAADAERVRAGLDALLEWHLRSARAQSDRFNSYIGVICLDAVVALLVAHQRGLTIPVAAKYRRAEVPLLAVYLTEWEERPVERGEKLSLETDLVAGPWLAARGLTLADVPAGSGVRGGRRAQVARTLGKGELEPAIVAAHVRAQLERGLGTVWQLMSWSLMTGDLDAAQRHLRAATDRARRELETTKPPNSNYVRTYFGLALAAGDDRAVEDAAGALRASMNAAAEDEARRAPAIPAQPYGHATGYLDLIADLLGPAGRLRAPTETVFGPLGVRTACAGLQTRDGAMVKRGIESILEEHAQQLERRTSPPPPLCEAAIHLAVAAQRWQIRYDIDQHYTSYPVPIIIRDPANPKGRLGRLPCDLMGVELFNRAS